MKKYLVLIFLIIALAIFILDRKQSEAPMLESGSSNITNTKGGYVYEDKSGFKITLPKAFSDNPGADEYGIDKDYVYTSKGPGEEIYGVKFMIPKSEAMGTNLSSDSYISVEYLPEGVTCDASIFSFDTSSESKIVRDGGVEYSMVSTLDAGAGNRYEETIYARKGSSPCVAVRYFIHYGAIENFEKGAVIEFDKNALTQEFDNIRRTLTID